MSALVVKHVQHRSPGPSPVFTNTIPAGPIEMAPGRERTNVPMGKLEKHAMSFPELAISLLDFERKRSRLSCLKTSRRLQD